MVYNMLINVVKKVAKSMLEYIVKDQWHKLPATRELAARG